MMKQTLILALFMGTIPFAKAQHLLEALDAPSIKEAKCIQQEYAWVGNTVSYITDEGHCVCSASSDGRAIYATWNNTNQNWSCGNGIGIGTDNPDDPTRLRCVRWGYQNQGQDPIYGNIGYVPVCLEWSDGDNRN